MEEKKKRDTTGAQRMIRIQGGNVTKNAKGSCRKGFFALDFPRFRYNLPIHTEKP